jgi:hypothetical protein
MQNLQQKLMDQGLVGSLVLRENGAQIPLRFGRGELSKKAKLVLGPTTVEVLLCLEPVPNVTAEVPNVTLAIRPADWRSNDPYTAAGDAAFKQALAEGKDPQEAGAIAMKAAAAAVPSRAAAPVEPTSDEVKVKADADAKAAAKAAEDAKAKADADAKAAEEAKEKADAEAKVAATPTPASATTDKQIPTEGPASSTTPVPPASSGGKNKSR